MNKELRMSFGDHLEELRTRLILCVIVIGIAAAGCWIFREFLLHLITQPVVEAQQKAALHRLRLKAEEEGQPLPEGTSTPVDLQQQLIVPNVEGAFMIHVRVVIFSAIFCAFPFCLYQAWSFVRSGLYSAERKYVYRFLPFSIGLFVVGVVLAYLYMLPVTLYFLLTFDNSIVSLLHVNFAISFVTQILLVMGLVFETPLVMLFLNFIGIGTPAFFVHYRRYFILIAAIVSAILTPQDILSMVMMAVPLIILYEFGIILIRLIGKKVKPL